MSKTSSAPLPIVTLQPSGDATYDINSSGNVWTSYDGGMLFAGVRL